MLKEARAVVLGLRGGIAEVEAVPTMSSSSPFPLRGIALEAR
jgi:hypothetical protein